MSDESLTWLLVLAFFFSIFWINRKSKKESISVDRPLAADVTSPRMEDRPDPLAEARRYWGAAGSATFPRRPATAPPVRPAGTSDAGRDISDWSDEGPLVLLGYRVGKTKGLPEAERREILRKALDDHIPTHYAHRYAETWGTPSTTRRYQRIAEHLKLMIEMHRRRRSYQTAVAHWTSDLFWFRATFGARFGDHGR